jgi:hypothetical protein
LPDDELAAEAVDGMRLAIAERIGETETMPASGEPLRFESCVDRSHGCFCGHGVTST